MLFPERIDTVEQLDELLSRPPKPLVEFFSQLEGDIVVLGAGGKMGPSLAEMAVRASRESGRRRKVIAASRFSTPGLADRLAEKGVEVHRGDLLDRDFLRSLPDAQNVIFMAGRKFGTTRNKPLTWALNAYLPALVAERYRNSRIVCFSTGNVYPLVPVFSGGATEDTPPQPIGEYAQSALARERVFEYFSDQYGVPVTIIRLNYAVEMRYGVLLDVASRVAQREPISVAMPAFNAIWQGDANAYVLRSLAICSSPATVLNVTGPETISVRWLAGRFAELLGLDEGPRLADEEQNTAFLANASRCLELFGYPQVCLGRLIRWTAHWIQIGGPTYDKPTHFEVRTGEF